MPITAASFALVHKDVVAILTKFGLPLGLADNIAYAENLPDLEKLQVRHLGRLAHGQFQQRGALDYAQDLYDLDVGTPAVPATATTPAQAAVPGLGNLPPPWPARRLVQPLMDVCETANDMVAARRVAKVGSVEGSMIAELLERAGGGSSSAKVGVTATPRASVPQLSRARVADIFAQARALGMRLPEVEAHLPGVRCISVAVFHAQTDGNQAVTGSAAAPRLPKYVEMPSRNESTPLTRRLRRVRGRALPSLWCFWPWTWRPS
jgi:hypothetical protein